MLKRKSTKKVTRFEIYCKQAGKSSELMHELIKNNASSGWRETIKADKFNFMYCGLTIAPHEDEQIYDLLLNKKGCMINRYPRITFDKRRTFTYLMQSLTSLLGKSLEFLPRTFVFPEDEAEFKQYQEANDDAVFIARPNSGSIAEATTIFNNLK